MITVTRKDFIDWLKSKDDNAPVNQKESDTDMGGCGCLMVQYGKEVLNLDNFYCGSSSWWALKNSKGLAEFAGDQGLGEIINPAETFLNTVEIFSEDFENFGDIKPLVDKVY